MNECFPMSDRKISLARVLVLKAEARELEQRERIKHVTALQRIARREGFPSWQRLLAEAGGREALHAILGLSARKLERLRRYKEEGNS